MKRIGVLIVEDSDVIRLLLEHIISADGRFEIVASVASAEAALKALDQRTPDVISLDIRLPGMDGFEATRRIMRDKPTPIVVCSASVDAPDLQITMNALRAGALAVVEKPVGTTRPEYERLASTLCTQLAIMSDVKVVRQGTFAATGSTPASTRARGPVDPPRASSLPKGPPRLLALGASTGGPNAVVQVLNQLGAGCPLPVLLVQHMMPSFLAGFVAWLATVTPWRAVIGKHGEVPVAGTVYVAPAEHHLEFDGTRIRLTQGPAVSAQRPSATVLFNSVARSAGDTSVGVLLTGMGDDGADGLLAMRHAGGYTIAEHESTAVVYGMPKAAVDRGAACEALPLDRIAARVTALVAMERQLSGASGPLQGA